MNTKLRMFLSIPIYILWLILLPSQSARALTQFDCLTISEIPLAECQALVALYDSTHGSTWIYHTNWLETNTPSDWFGVTVELGSVTQLNLPANGLRGVLPSGLGNLVNLTTLDLGSNVLSGAIPPELGNLPVLEHLYLNSNQLSGEIPPQLGSLTHLSRLYLFDNLLSGPIPPALGDLTEMWNLWLSGNGLTGPIPKELSQLTSMEWLRLAGNQLSGTIPAELGLLTGLRQLSLGNNQLTGEIPSALGSMTSLEILSLNGNQLTGSIPVQLSVLDNLGELDLSSNQLTGNIPPEFGSQVNLYMLLLNDNQLSGDIPDLTGLVNLLPPDDPDGEGLDLDYNALVVPVNYPDPSSPQQLFLSQYDLEWHTLQAFDQIIGTAGGVLTSLDDRVSIDIPALALSAYTIFTFTPLLDPSYPSGGLADAHNSFQLTAEDTNTGLPVTSFTMPLEVTLYYSDLDLLGLYEATLALYYYDPGTLAWQDAVTTCYPGAYTRDPIANTISLPLCHLSDFSLFGHPTPHTFLPLVVRKAGG